MSRPTALDAPASSPADASAASGTQLQGRRRVAARAGWVVILIWIVANFAFSLPSQLHAFQHPGVRSTELAPAVVSALRQAGVSLDTYSWIAVGFGCLVMLVATALALMLFWRRGDDWMALLVALLFPAYCLLIIAPSESFNTAPSGSPLAVGNTLLLSTTTFAIIYAVFVLFPSGKFVPSWSWAILALCVVWFAARIAAPSVGGLFSGYFIFLGAAIAIQVYRYRKVSTPIQRQQTRWAVFGLVGALLAEPAFWLTAGLTPLSKTIYPSIAYLALYCSVLLIPVTFLVAILRYRLYEIDIIIRNTLIYGSLTAILAGVYFGVVLSAQMVIRRLTGHTGQQPIAIVSSTLLIAGLFTSLRRRLQTGIDRAFYRSKYDATRSLALLASHMQMETDLDDLRAHVVDAVLRTMQPAHVSLWLRAPHSQGASTSTDEGATRY